MTQNSPEHGTTTAPDECGEHFELKDTTWLSLARVRTMKRNLSEMGNKSLADEVPEKEGYFMNLFNFTQYEEKKKILKLSREFNLFFY